ncbi:phage portal protein [Brachyspira innocens]|uniref:anti-CBASS protein Acb1 family protein n=1 Tax=Brachyspira innocens TaxID=13264 RepID=UPI0026F097F0|nr:anti-CBASS Acb1 family protein [Brachyspira innocens]
MAFFREGEKTKLSYEECKNIYRNATMGKRVVEGLVNFAMSAEREIDVQKAPPEAIQKFKETAKVLKQEEAIKQTIYNARIYGTGGLYVAMYNEEEEKDDFTTKPTFEDAYKYKIRFNVLDPLNLSGSRVDNDPLSFHFLELVDIKVNTKTVPRKRISISHALEPLYLDNRTSLLPFTPPSVFYNMIDLLKEYDDAIKSIGDLLYKAGAIVYKYPAKSKLNGVFADAQERSQIILQQKQSGEVISISADSSLEDFPISNLSGLIEAINKLEDDITKALNDTPASILFDKSLSNGFSEGDKDKETEISIIESFRENKLTPLYELTDYYVMLKAWDSNFIDEMRSIYSNYEDKSNIEIFRDWAESFTFKYGNLFPEPESLIQENNAKKLDNLLKVQQLGANIADIEEELNESEIFKNEMELEPQGMGGMENEEESENEAMFDYSKNNSEDEANFNKPPSVSGIKADTNNFKEEEHKRDKDGKFTKGSGENDKQKEKEETNNEDSSEEDKQKEEKEIKEKIEQLEKIDWTKDNTLPNFPKSFLKKQGLEDKPILLKKNIIERNKQQHPDITEEQAIRILGNSLYRTEAILKGKSKRPDYYNLITRIDDKHNDLVTVELSNEKDNYEIVHFFVIRNTTRKKYERDNDELKNKS